MRQPYRVGADIHVLPSDLPIPGAGLQPVNAFLDRGREPLLVDTGMPVDRDGFEQALWSLIEPHELRWILVTHDDRDHTGSLPRILAAAPRARLVINGTSSIRLAEEFSIPAGRVLRVNPGQRCTLGDRTVSLLRPPTFDSPGTVAAFDHTAGTLFSSDSFGTVLPHPVEDLADATERDFLDGFGLFNRAISPWLTLVDPARFHRSVRVIQRLNPHLLLSSHAPVAAGRTDWLVEAMAQLPTLPAWLPDSDLDVEAAITDHELLAG